MENITYLNEIKALKNKITELECLVKFYEEQFKLSKKRQFGQSSEKSIYDQLVLENEDELLTEGYENEKEPDVELVKEHYRKKRTRADGLPKDLPVDEIVYELSGEERACPDCGSDMQAIGHERRDELVVIPAKVSLRRHAARTYACKECAESSEQTPIKKAGLPKPVIKGSFASPESIAYAAHQKFVMGIPLYRQEQEWQRQGVLLSRQTLANWLIVAAESWLSPIVDELKRQLLARDVIHGDETTFQVLREEGKNPRSKSYLWCYRTSGDADEPIVSAEYKPDRKTSNPANFLAGFKGFLHADGYEAYHKLPSSIVIVGCWAHVRRKWDEALKIIKTVDREGSEAARGKRYCDKLFAIEKELAELNARERFDERLKRLRPVMDEFFSWTATVRAIPKSSLGRAVAYMVSQKKYLRNVLMDGRLELSNNRVERTIKPFVICRKNFLFANTPRGANAAAIIFSIVETAKETGVNPFDYLTYVFKTAPNVDMGDPEKLRGLLPAAYKKLSHDMAAIGVS